MDIHLLHCEHIETHTTVQEDTTEPMTQHTYNTNAEIVEQRIRGLKNGWNEAVAADQAEDFYRAFRYELATDFKAVDKHWIAPKSDLERRVEPTLKTLKQPS